MQVCIASVRASTRPTRSASFLGVLVLLVALLAGCSGSAPAETEPSGGNQAPDGSTPPAQPIALTLTPADTATDVAPGDPVTVTAANGRLTEVKLTNADGKQVAGQLSPDGTSWTSTEPLGFGKNYTLTATGQGADGATATATSNFTTAKARSLAFVSMSPLNGETVGVGQPLAFYFDKPVADKKAAEEAIHITTEPNTEGAFYWFSDTEVHWRPREYWKPGTKVTIDVKMYGKHLGNGVYGKQDRRSSITIGDAVIARADGATHQMSVEVNGQVVRTVPVSLGSPQFPSNNGIHVVTEKHPTKVMDSTSYGLPLDRGGYRTTVQWAVRISNGGEFVHAAPWSVQDQGHRNVSHGCINLSTENAKWYFDLVKKGDLVIITNSGGPDLKPWDGLGDWQIPWEEWVKGGKR